MLKYSRRNACFEHSILFTVNEAVPATDNLMPVTFTTKMDLIKSKYTRHKASDQKLNPEIQLRAF